MARRAESFVSRWRLPLLVCIGLASGWATPGAGELLDGDLERPRTISEGGWLALRLQVLGLQLTYPAYRVDLELSDSNVVHFEFWLSTPMSQHLQESGRKETERLLTYHAEGIMERVAELLQRDFPRLWTSYDGESDFEGQFMVPGEELDAPPQRWARWRTGRFAWEP